MSDLTDILGHVISAQGVATDPSKVAAMLGWPDFSRDFVVETDASEVGIGAVLSQNNHPISFISKALAEKHKSLSTKIIWVGLWGFIQAGKGECGSWCAFQGPRCGTEGLVGISGRIRPPLAEWWYNTNHHSSTGMTPYEAVYGQPAHVHLPYVTGDSPVAEVDRSLKLPGYIQFSTYLSSRSMRGLPQYLILYLCCSCLRSRLFWVRGTEACLRSSLFWAGDTEACGQASEGVWTVTYKSASWQLIVKIS